MSEFKTKAEDLGQSVKDYVETYYKLSILKASDKATGIIASGLAAVSIVFLGILVLFFLGIAMGVWLGNLLNNAVAGYLLVAAFFLLITVILVALRKKIVFPMIRNSLIRKFYE